MYSKLKGREKCGEQYCHQLEQICYKKISQPWVEWELNLHQEKANSTKSYFGLRIKRIKTSLAFSTQNEYKMQYTTICTFRIHNNTELRAIYFQFQRTLRWLGFSGPDIRWGSISPLKSLAIPIFKIFLIHVPGFLRLIKVRNKSFNLYKKK